MIIETSQDLLFVALAVCALWLTVFLSWFLYYMIAILRDTESMTKQGRKIVEKIDHLVHSVHEKVEHSAASLTLIGQALKEVAVWAMNERARKREEMPAAKKTRRKTED